VVESVGEENVGFAVATYGLASTFASLGAGKISDAVGRGPVTVVLLVGGVAALGWIREFPPHEGALRTVLEISVLCGVGLGPLSTMVTSYVSAAFLDEIDVAYACIVLVNTTACERLVHVSLGCVFTPMALCWQIQTLASAFGFFYSAALSLRTKALINGVALAAGVVGLLLAELDLRLVKATPAETPLVGRAEPKELEPAGDYRRDYRRYDRDYRRLLGLSMAM